ncbi:MAG: hypothetical protein JNM14_07240 [Ferruginibacter sp.]|nr:hypothetical protein [Ferruginibacter sp.]
MKEKENLTYILGAGASYESVPLVKNFARRFMFFVKSMGELINHPDVSFPDSKNIKKLHSFSLGLYKEISSHQSFDTFFKKLFHTQEYARINLYKKVLNIYFLWESATIQNGNASENDINEKQEGDFIKKSKIDKRYDALVAGLLVPKKGIIQPYCKVNFLTWNYDLNLLMSLKNYLAPNNTIGGFLSSIDKGGGVWKYKEDFTIINMNGYFYRSEINNLTTITNVQINELIFSIIKEDYFDDMVIDHDSNLLKFAWESENKLIPIAKLVIDGSSNIVIIGYTFPLYNRLVDLSYLEQSIISHKKIFIQDPNGDIIRQNLIDYYQLKDNQILEKNLKSIKDCDSFYIPSDVFGIKQMSRIFVG